MLHLFKQSKQLIKAALAGALVCAGILPAQAQGCHAYFNYSAKNDVVSFHDSSTSKAVHQRFWSFGDGTHSDAENPAHTYAKDGSYNVCLRIHDTTNKCYDTACVTIKLVTTTTSGCHAMYVFSTSGLTAFFTDSSSTANAHSRSWSFGDGHNGDGATPHHTYASAGTYKVCLTIRDTIAKCDNTYCNTVTVSSPSSCSAKFLYNADGKKVTFHRDTTNSSTAMYIWKFGDGTIDTSYDRSVVHTYARDTVYRACLFVIDTAHNCHTDNCGEVDLRNNIYSIYGHVSADSNNAYPGRVWLIVFNSHDSSLKAIAKGEIHHDSTGAFYRFEHLSPGTYYTKTALDTTASAYKHYVPTYHNDALKWAKAQKITITNADITDANIKLRKGTNPGGRGFVGGKISQGANKTGDPMGDIEVLFLDENDNPVLSAFTDSLGRFSFDGLANGHYQVYPEIEGLTTFPAWVEISDNNSRIDNVEMVVNSTTVTTAIHSVSAPVEVKVYPNPVHDRLMIQLGNVQSQDAALTVSDITGRTYMSENVKAMNNETLQVSTAKMSKGVYFVKLQLKDGSILMNRFVKD
jgi:PKD repeat protein